MEDYDRVYLSSWIMWGIGASVWLWGRTSDIQDELTASSAGQATPEIWYEIEELGILKLSGFGWPEIKETYKFTQQQWHENN